MKTISLPTPPRRTIIAAIVLLAGMAAHAQQLSWTRTSLQLDDLITSIVANGETLIVGTAGKGIYRSTDAGTTWAPVSLEASGFEVRALIDDGEGSVIAGTSKGAFRSTDGGATWKDISTGLSATGKRIEAFDRRTGLVVAATDDGIYYLPTELSAWSPAGLQGRQVMTVAFDHRQSIQAATVQNLLFHATLTGGTGEWVQSTTTITGVLAMVGDSATGKVFATSSELYVTSDQGVSWQPGSYSSLLIFTIVRDAAGRILIGDYDGMTISSDHGNTWTPMRGPNAPEKVMSIAVGNDGTIYAGTFDGDLYVSGGPSSVDHEAMPAAGPLLGGIYPNPARDRVRLPFSLPRRAEARITLSDALGRVVAGKDAGTLEAGAHEVDLDIASCPSGCYLCTLTSDGIIRTRMMTILR